MITPSDQEIKNIVAGIPQTDTVELFLPMQIKVRGSKAGSIVIAILSALCFVVAVAFFRSLLQTNNPVDKKLFTTLSLAFAVIALLLAWATYRLYKKIKQVNSDENNYGIWLTKKYLVCNDTNEGIKFLPLAFITNFKPYQSTRPPLQMLIAEVKPPFKPLRMVCNYLAAWQTPEQLGRLLSQRMLALQVPDQYLAPIESAIRFAEGYEDPKKIFLLNNKLQEMVKDLRPAAALFPAMVKYIDSKLTHWNEECRIIPEDWVFEKEVNENWEYGVNGVSYSEKWNAPVYPGNWLMAIGRVFIVESAALEPYFRDAASCNNMAHILSQCPLKKLIIKIPLTEDCKSRTRKALADHEQLKQTEII